MIIYTPKIYARALFSLYKEKKLNSETLKNFLKLLFKNNQLKILPRILENFGKLYKDDLKILEANIYTPQKLNEKELNLLKKEIERRYQSPKIILNEIIDKNLIGGLKLQIEDEIIDASLKNLLFKLEKLLIR